MICATPHVTALSTRYLRSHCSSCHEEEKNGRPLKRCQQCKTIIYCDQTCQKFDWPLHKFECPALVAHAERHVAGTEPGESDEAKDTRDTVPVPSETIRALGRLLWLQSRAKPGSGKRKEFELMQSHREKLTPSSPQTASYTRLGHALAAYVSHGEPSPEKLSALGIGSAKDIVDLLSKFSTNAHTLSTPSLTPIGVAISPVAALINHSSVCTIQPPAIADAIRVGEEGLEKAEALQFDDPEYAFKLTSNLIPILSRFFHVGAHPLLSLARLHLSLLISQLESSPQILDETIRAAARVAAGVSAIYSAGHPTRGIAYAELGKLLAADEYVPPGEKPLEATPSQLDPKANVVWVAGDDDDVVRGFDRLRMAHYSLLSARKELVLGFGYINEGGAVGREVTELAKQLEREVAIWRKAGGGKRPSPGASL
ncbi:hypothetical protein FRC06_007059 [Ceratobasidium sp. 370]|nr:hypothetical protein FRC06_007059 [Ceratobasidium sp. 370]